MLNQPSEVTKSALKEAYKLVQTDLLNTFQKMRPNQMFRLTNIGVFEKKQKSGVSKLPNGSYGKSYQWYQIGFRMSKTLKEALD